MAGKDGVSKVNVFVLIDALGWRFLDGRPFLPDLLPYRSPLRTVLGFSSGAVPTILTGVTPDQHGHWNLFYLDLKHSPFRWVRFFDFLPDSILDTRIARKIVKELGRKVLGMGPNFECCVPPRLMRYFNWVEKRNVYAHGGVAGAPSIFDHLTKRGTPYRVYSYHEHNDREILQLARRDILSGNAGFFFIYLSEMDMFLHLHCREPRELDSRLAWYEAELREVMTCASMADPDFCINIFSDHGMTPIDHHFDLMKVIDDTGLTIGRDYLAVYDSTMARFWFWSPNARAAIVSVLETVGCGRILTDLELKSLGVFFEDRRYGELVFLLEPGWLIARSDFNGPQWIPMGMHGYHPDDSFSDAVFLSNRPPTRPMKGIWDIWHRMQEAIS